MQELLGPSSSLCEVRICLLRQLHCTINTAGRTGKAFGGGQSVGAVIETGTGLSNMPRTFCSPALGVSSVCRADPGALAMRLLSLTET